ncbi:Helix-turn-helix domain-containing protein [Pseudobutyrivibrio sp. C4]|uniref:helix-turn-helix domain-containing protein n=1 Tax=Pseudobutyrivibrio sp. C4 TaxID=1520803 RepID=UPI0008B1BCEA|nr:helix-turn-helix transcriptional regulator [Pseudobutyrivibrio sp. C4]SET12864.1 Helix-turn-helix domain-containing protein [Pseudobutyrivibrio sp. C4]
MVNLYQKTWKEINNEVASNVQKLRKRKKISQKELAERSGVSLGSIKRFEQTGEISLQSLTKIAIALRAEDELESLFTSANFESIEEILNGQS